MPINREEIKNILVVRNDRFGEFLLNIPAFRAVKESFPQALLIAVVDPRIKELVKAIKCVDETKEWASGRHPLKEKIALFKWLRAKSIDLAIMLNPSRDFNLLTFIAGIPIRAGYDRKLGFLLNYKIKDAKHLAEKHEVDYNLDLVGLVGARTYDKSLSLAVGGNSNNPEILGRAIVLHPWASDPVKQWPEESFRLLAEKIISEIKVKVLIIGGQENMDKSQRLFCGFDNSLLDMTGRTTFGELALLLKESRLLVSGDSGPVHLGCA
ncbi:MAG: glycosyltransferase family 9 protein, partial [Candidatus Omnitrophota bacterium]